MADGYEQISYKWNDETCLKNKYLTDSEGNIFAGYIYRTYGELLKGDTNITLRC